MTAIIGQTSILLALALSLWGVVAPFLFSKTRNQLLFTSIRIGILGQFVFVTLAAASLIYALVTTDFSIQYVAFNTTRATPIYYRITGLWGA